MFRHQMGDFAGGECLRGGVAKYNATTATMFPPLQPGLGLKTKSKGRRK